MTSAASNAASGGGGLPLWLVLQLAFVGLLALALALVFGPQLRRARRRRKERLDELHRYRLLGAMAGEPVELAETVRERSELTARALDVVDRVMRARGHHAQVRDRLERAGLRTRPEEWVALQGLVIAALAVLPMLLLGTIFVLPVGGLAGWFGCQTYLRTRTAKRAAAFEANLPDALQLLAGALRSGFALNQSIGAVVREGVEPVASEFGRALHEVRLGSDLVEALDATAARMGSYDMELVVMAIRTSKEVGGNLAEVLGTTVAMMRERVQLRGQVKILSAEGRLSAKVLVALPLVMTGYLLLVRRDYLRPLYTTGVGYVLVVAGVSLLVTGSFWLSRLTKIEV